MASWDGFTDSELARIRSSVVGYEVQWRWFDGGIELTSNVGGISPLHRSYTIQDLVPGRDYDVRVRASSSTHDYLVVALRERLGARNRLVGL